MLASSLIILSIYWVNAFAYKTIIDVLSEDSRFETLIQHLQRTRLIPRINRLPAGTLFAPDNNAFAAFEGNVDEATLLYHILPSGMTAADFYHGQLLQSIYVRPGFLPNNEGQRVKVTYTGLLGRTLFVNDAQIIKKDIPVNRNTYIQAIDRVLEPPETIGRRLKKESKEFYGLLQSIGLEQLLDEGQPFTVFLPQQNLMHPFNEVEKAYLMSKHGCQDLSHILNYAVLDTPIYASDFPKGKTVYTTMTQETIVVARDGEVITVNDIPVVRTDYLASNGVIHILDDGLIPGSLEFDSRKYLYGINATKMVFLLDKYGLGHYLEKNVDDFYTFLVPSNDALNEDMIPNIIKKDWLSYHIVDASWTPKHLEDGMLLPSEFRSVGLNGASQRIPVYIKARNWKDMDVKDDQSIRFGRSRVFNHIAQSKNIIYQISEPLTLPTDILTSLVLDLDMSTFVATLYVSGVMNEMRSAKGITVFAPTNDAFQQLGLVAKYLVHPTGKQHLQTVLRYHAVQALLYQKDMESSRVVANTLANVSMNIIGSNGKILVGEATVDHGNLMVSNGVIHKLDQVQIPSTVQITHHHLLTAIEANAMQELLRRANISELAEDHVLLAPTDRAFDRIDFEALLNDTEKMLRVAKLHILKTSSPDANEFPTLLSSDDMVIIRDAGYGLWTVQVKGLNTAHARVLGKGNVTKGFVLEIDTVLMPMQRGFFGLPLDVIEEFARMASPVLICLICFGGWIAYRLWRRRRTGYETIRDGEEAESNQ